MIEEMMTVRITEDKLARDIHTVLARRGIATPRSVLKLIEKRLQDARKDYQSRATGKAK